MAIDLGYDESGSDDVLLVTMQVGITEQARKMRRKWRKELRGAGIAYFHSKEFNTPENGVFANLSRPERLRLLGNLSRTSVQHLSIGMTGKVTKSAFDQRTTNDFRSQFGTAYTFAIHILLAGAYFFAKHVGLRPEFNVLIEDGHRNAAQAVECLTRLKTEGFNSEMAGCRLLSVGLGAKPDHPILQAADMLAYSEWQKMRGGDSTIYAALHPPSLRFQPEMLDFDGELVDAVLTGAEEWLARRKAFGRAKYAQRAAGRGV